MAKTTAFQTVPTIPIQIEGSIFFAFDSFRNKFLTADRRHLPFGKKGRAATANTSLYLRTVDGLSVASTGYRMNRAGTVTSITAQSEGTNPWVVNLRRNGDNTNLSVLNVSGGGSHDNLVNVDLDEGDTVQINCTAPSLFGIKHPLVLVEVAYRLV